MGWNDTQSIKRLLKGLGKTGGTVLSPLRKQKDNTNIGNYTTTVELILYTTPRIVKRVLAKNKLFIYLADECQNPCSSKKVAVTSCKTVERTPPHLFTTRCVLQG